MGVEVLTSHCCICHRDADFRVTRSNECLPHPYWREGTRAIYYCGDHLPLSVRRFINNQKGG